MISRPYINRFVPKATMLPGPVLMAVVILMNIVAGGAQAQSDGGLKLGQPPEKTESTLDLGAAPADKPAQPDAEAAPVPDGGNPDPSGARESYGAWEVACAADGNNCAMAQIGNDAGGTPILEMVVRKLEEPLEVGERTAIAVLDVITPLGVVLPEGLSVKIDGGREESAQFQVCTEQGCLVREPIDGDLIARFKRGNNAVVSVIAANQGEVSASISLSGFTKAFDALK